MKNEKIKRIAVTSILAAIASILYTEVKFPVPAIFPEFLDINISMIPILICAMVVGPIDSIGCVVIRFIMKMMLRGSNTMMVGELADLILGIFVAVVVGFVYQMIRKKKEKINNETDKDLEYDSIIDSVISLSCGILTWVIIAVIANVFVLVPFYISLYFKGNVDAFIGLLSMIPGVTEQNYMIRYVIFSVIPFNLMLGILVSGFTFMVHKRIRTIYLEF